MPFDIADLFAKRRLVNVEYGGATLELHYAPARFDAETVSNLSTLVSGPAGALPDLRRMAEVVAYVAVDWNATDDGEPLPLTTEELIHFDAGLLVDILGAIQEDYNASKNGKSLSSTSPPTGNSAKRRRGSRS